MKKIGIIVPSLLLSLILILALFQGAAIPANADGTSGYTVSCSENEFTVKRPANMPAETVLYRTVGFSAISGVHFTAKSGELVFLENETEKKVTVAEKTPTADAYMYQTAGSRTYRFEVLGRDGTILAYCNRLITNGVTKFTADKVSSSVSNLVTLSGGNFSSGMSSARYVDVGYTPGSVESEGTLKGYVLIDDSYNYAQKPATVSTSALINSTGVSADYLDTLGYKIYAAVCFTEKERDDGYQYVQIVAGTSSASYDGADSNGKIDNGPDNSVYKVCFELSNNSNSEGKIYFPHRETGSSEFSLSTGVLHQQAFKSSSYNGGGAVILPVTMSNITTRFDAAGDNDDTWGFKDFFVRMALCDPVAPTVLDYPEVSPGPYGYGHTVYISVPFSEAVKVSGTPTLNTSWGTLSYFGGSGSNVLTFKGTIDAPYDTALSTTSLGGTITDLAGNALGSSNKISRNFSFKVGLPWAGNGTQDDPYMITTAAHLDFMAQRVNAVYNSSNFSGKYFELGADISFSRSAKWDDTTAHEDNFTPIGRWGGSFCGNFDGKGHTISGIRVYRDSAGNYHDNESLGLFGFVSGGTVENVVLRDANIEGLMNTGGIVGYLGSGSKVKNCLLYQVRVATTTDNPSFPNQGIGVIVGKNNESSVSGSHYRDCCLGSHANALSNHYCSDLYVLTAAAGVSAGYVSGERAAVDDVTYYAEGCTFTLGYTGTLQTASVLSGYAAKDWIGNDIGTVSGNTYTVGASDCTVSPVWAPAWEGGGENENDPYIISTTGQLDLLAKMVNAQDGYAYNGFKGKFFALDRDIEYSHETEWDDAGSTENNFTAIGRFYNSNLYFRGNFDGRGHVIRGIRIYKNGSNMQDYFQGLFGAICENGTVKNVTVADARITGHNFVGGIAGEVVTGTIDNCRVEGDVCINTVSGGWYLGGAVGSNGDSIFRSVSCATVTDSGTSARYCGGVAGCNNGEISNCLAFRVSVPVLSDTYGAVVGCNYGTLSCNCYYNCTVGGVLQATGVGAGTAYDGTSDTDGVCSAHLILSGTDTVAKGAAFSVNGVSYYAAGSTVTLSFTPSAGCALKNLNVTDAVENRIEADDYTFTMPASDVNVYAEFAPYYTVTIDPSIEHGTVGANCEYYFEGDVVALTVIPDTGYKLVSLTVTGTPDVTDNTFTVQTSNITVTAVFGLTDWAILNEQFANASTEYASPTYITLDKDYTADAYDEALFIPSGKYVVLDLNGHTLDRHLTANTENGSVITVYGFLRIDDSSDPDAGAIKGGFSTGSGGGVYVGSGAMFTLYDGAVTGNSAYDGGGVYVGVNARFIMNGGTVSNNTADEEGGGVYVHGGTFIMNGGSITGNNAPYAGGVHVSFARVGDVDAAGNFTLSDGCIISYNNATYCGCVAIYNKCVFDMNGGTISNNTTYKDGGGVYLSYGTFNMRRGSIVNNTSQYGGGVYTTRAAFNMYSGTISGNTATYSGGGIYMTGGTDGVFNMAGGTVSGNTAGKNSDGGGVYINGGAFNVSGSPVVTGNTNNNGASNVYLPTGKVITVTDTLDSAARIGVKTNATPAVSAPVVFTSGISGNGSIANFISDNGDYRVLIRNGEAVLCITYFVNFESGGGSGTMETVDCEPNVNYTVPDCGFTAPEGTMFVGWLDSDGYGLAPGAKLTMNKDYTLTAVFVTYHTVTIEGLETGDTDDVETKWEWNGSLNDYYSVTCTGSGVIFPDGASLDIKGLPWYFSSSPALTADEGYPPTYTLNNARTDVTVTYLEGYSISVKYGGVAESAKAYARPLFDDGVVISSAPAGATVYLIASKYGGGNMDVRYCTVTGKNTGKTYESGYVDDDWLGSDRYVIYAFVMPDEAVDAYICVESPIGIMRDNCEHGSVSAANSGDVYKGDTVTLILTPDAGYVVDTVSYCYYTDYITITPENGVYSFTVTDDYVTVCATFKRVDPSFTAHALVLTSEIGVKYRVSFPEGYNAEGVYMSFLAADGRNAVTTYADAVDIENSTDKYFIFRINALELAENIEATLHFGENWTLTDTYSAMTYIQAIQNDGGSSQKLLDLVNALHKYGYYMQLSGWTDDKPSHTPIPAPSGLLDAASIDAAKTAVDGYKVTLSIGDSGIVSSKFSLTLNEQTKINISVKPGEGTVITSTGYTEKIIGGETYYQFTTPKIGPKQLGNEYLITVETNKGTATYSSSAMAYVRIVLNSSGSFTEAKQNAMAAYYYYYKAALDY